MVLLQETRVAIGESASMDKLYNMTWGFVNTPGRTKWTESDISRGGGNALEPVLVDHYYRVVARGALDTLLDGCSNSSHGRHHTGGQRLCSK